VAGLVVRDLFRTNEVWLLDEGLTACARPGMAIASRLCWPDEFAMTCGVLVPVDAQLVEEALAGGLAWSRHDNAEKLAEDPRFATAVYRTAVENGVMQSVVFQQTASAA
jgi:hypothetical protein